MAWPPQDLSLLDRLPPAGDAGLLRPHAVARSGGWAPIHHIERGAVAAPGQRASGPSLLPDFTPEQHSSRERELRQQVVETVLRAVDRYLMMSTEGVVSARVDEQSFLITPTRLDRGSLEIEDIVLIRDGQREQRQTAQPLCLFAHGHLHDPPGYRLRDHRAASLRQRPMPLARSGSIRTIPESYVLLRDIPIFPYGAQFREPQPRSRSRLHSAGPFPDLAE